jgi:ARG/rhodanese/phosphatase superfamily protein
MHRLLPTLAATSLALLSLGAPAARAEEYRVSGPFTHENLSIYFVHGKSAEGRVPLTLDEALAKRAVRVHETGDVNQLAVENLGDEDVFIQSGDIVKGGQQDRALTVSLILPPKSGRLPLAAFCVEQGRWSARGREDVKTFTTASAAVPSREAKIAMKAPIAETSDPAAPAAMRERVRSTSESDTSTRQYQVWKRVRAIQDRLSANVGAPVNATASQTSLQLALENEKLRDLQAAYVKALEQAAKDADVVGYVFAINGKLNSGDIYPSNGLFRKMWSKLLRASVTEAIGEKDASAEAAPSTEAVMAFLDAGMKGKSTEKALPADIQLETRTGDKALYFETRRNGAWVHRNYLAM